MRAKRIVSLHAIFLTLILSGTSGAANAFVFVSWDFVSPTHFSADNLGSQEVFAIIFPHARATSAYTTNGWSAQLVSRMDWENGSFVFTDPNGWTAPVPASFDWDTVFPASDSHSQVVAYWLGAGAATPLAAGGIVDGFWTDTYPFNEWAGIALNMSGSTVRLNTSSLPIPLPLVLFLSGIASFAFLKR